MTLFVALLSAICGGFVALLSFRMNTNKEHVFFMLKKAEELFLAVDRFKTSLDCYYLNFYAVMQGKISYNDMLDLQIRNGTTAHEPHRFMRMLCRFYFPPLLPKLEAFIGAQANANKVTAKHRKDYERGADGIPWIAPLDEALLLLDQAAKELSDSIIAEGQRLSRLDSILPKSLAAVSAQFSSNFPAKFRSRSRE
jgi:hypothetical protein